MQDDQIVCGGHVFLRSFARNQDDFISMYSKLHHRPLQALTLCVVPHSSSCLCYVISILCLMLPVFAGAALLLFSESVPNCLNHNVCSTLPFDLVVTTSLWHLHCVPCRYNRLCFVVNNQLPKGVHVSGTCSRNSSAIPT